MWQPEEEETEVRIWRRKVWSPFDLGLFKVSMILLGMVLGALLSDFVEQYLSAFVVVGLLLVVRPVILYFRDGD
jgi:putative Mn2+ efflux pump MntP